MGRVWGGLLLHETAVPGKYVILEETWRPNPEETRKRLPWHVFVFTPMHQNGYHGDLDSPNSLSGVHGQ